MAKVVYNERGIDRRELGAADLAKAGVEDFKKTVFHKNEPVEVTDEVAKVLTEDKRFPGFRIVTEEQAEVVEEKAAKADEEAPDTGSAQESTGTPRAPKSIKSSTP